MINPGFLVAHALRFLSTANPAIGGLKVDEKGKG